MNDTRTIASTIERFNENRAYFRWIPLESSVSLPVPILMSKGKVYLGLLFFTGKRLKRKERIKLFRPNTKIVIQHPSAKIAFYRDYSALDEFPSIEWCKPIGEFPHKEIESLNLKEYTGKRKDLLTKYDHIISLFRRNMADGESKYQFRNSFYELCEPGLLPFMKKIGKPFFTWLHDSSKITS